MSLKNVVVVSAKRTPIGSFQGTLSSLSATDLGAHVLKETLKESGLESQNIEAVFMGCVLSAGLGQAPARQAALKAGLPQTTHCTTINKGKRLRKPTLMAQKKPRAFIWFGVSSCRGEVLGGIRLLQFFGAA